MTNITRQLAEFAAGISCETVPQEAIERTQMLVMDNVGIALRARHDAESTPALVKGAMALGLDGGTSVAIGDRRGFTPAGAALINGTLAHSLDFDDTHAASSLHPSAPIVPAALAAAEMAGADGEELIPAIIAGYEIQIRLSKALGPSDHYDRGFHPTATCGVFGAAAAAGRLFCLDAEHMALAFGIALSQSAGSMQFLVDGAWTKRFHVGHAAMCGLMAASFAKEGFRGAVDAFEGKAGFLHAYAPASDPLKAVDGLGEDWQTLGIAVKPYPSCRYSHAALDALIDLRAANDIQPDEVESVFVGLPETGWKIIGDPEEAKHNPTGVVDGQFSMAFCAAVALREGGLTWDDYAKHIGDKKTLDLCRRVQVQPDARAGAEFPDNMAGLVRMTTKQGEFESFVAMPKGEPDNFLTADELRAKFDGLVSPYLPAKRVDELATRLANIFKEDDINEVLRLTRPVAAELQAAGE
ncbi:MAG: MmgE/PrpD family protein [Rhodospirillales bacterium]|nr:MmgE/PrpD family protein [Alphaproteobacteria bacterium]MBL6947334.1 MmgE/PrpD family protein [Rhodospirillales bacterium]